MAYTLSEYESKQLLANAGIPIPEERLASSPDEAVCAAEELGYPVALKLCGRGIAHKTERNLVRLDLGSAEGVRGQAEELLPHLVRPSIFRPINILNCEQPVHREKLRRLPHLPRQLPRPCVDGLQVRLRTPVCDCLI